MPYKFNMLRDTMNMGGNSEEEAEKQAKREEIVASKDPIAIKRQAIADQWEKLNSPEYQKKSLLEKIASAGEQTTAQKADFENTAGAVMGSMQGIPSAGIGSGLKSFKGIVPSTAGRTAEEAAEVANRVLSEPGLANLIKSTAQKSSVQQMAPKSIPTTLPETMSLLDRIKLAKVKSWGSL